MVSAKRKGHSIVRNSSFFKKISTPPICNKHPTSSPKSAVSSQRSLALPTFFSSLESGPESSEDGNGRQAAEGNQLPAANNGQPQIKNRDGNVGPAEHDSEAEDDSKAELDSEAKNDSEAEDDSEAEVFVDAEEEENRGPDTLQDNPQDAPSGNAAANPIRPAFHPSPGLSVRNRPFSLPESIRPGSLIYNFRQRPGGRTD